MTINDAFPANVWSNEAPSNGRVAAAPCCCENATGSVSGPFPGGSSASPEKLSRAVAEAALLLTSVKVVVQLSSAAKCATEPMKLRPEIEAASCCTLNDIPATVNVPDRAAPKFAAAGT